MVLVAVVYKDEGSSFSYLRVGVNFSLRKCHQQISGNEVVLAIVMAASLLGVVLYIY